MLEPQLIISARRAAPQAYSALQFLSFHKGRAGLSMFSNQCNGLLGGPSGGCCSECTSRGSCFGVPTGHWELIHVRKPNRGNTTSHSTKNPTANTTGPIDSCHILPLPKDAAPLEREAGSSLSSLTTLTCFKSFTRNIIARAIVRPKLKIDAVGQTWPEGRPLTPSTHGRLHNAPQRPFHVARLLFQPWLPKHRQQLGRLDRGQFQFIA